MNMQVFDLLWKRVLEAWDEEAPHADILELALRTDMLAELAGRYRTIKDSDPERAARAEARLDAIVSAATQLLTLRRSPPPRKTSGWSTLSAAVCCLVLIAQMLWAFLKNR